ncbi:MAG: chemotaxis protein [Burkholderiales bacterium]|jgi:methyl-accepting chemotaxis protein|nr:MAG: chemotaxis protein [Burkholderiales bacterium]
MSVSASPNASCLPSSAPSASFGASFFAYHGFWAPGVRLFRAITFANKAMLISLVLFLPFVVLMGWQMKSQYEQALDEREDAIRQHVEVASSMLSWAYEQEKSGHLSRQQAQDLAIQTVARLRYDKNQYFWLNDMQPRMIMHPIKPELNGKDLSELRDPAGFPLFKEMVSTVSQHGRGFVRYQWPRPGSEQAVPKISFVQGFEPWGWIIGTGAYIDDLDQAFKHQLILVGSIIAMGVLVAGYLFICFYKVMDGGLKETRRHLRAITTGDLTTSPKPWGKDEAADLMLELRTMQDSLRHMVLQVRQSSSQIVRSSSEIAGGAMDLSSRTEQAAANLEETAASMEQITSTVQNSADNTNEASQVAQRNASKASDGGKAMEAVVQRMEAIRTSSAKISEIISTIDGIAFQTNILALNAAVEAARAGEQGRGFAVVASEVRMLAQRSANAAKEIKTILVKSVEEVEAGTTVVKEAGAAIEEIVETSQRVNQLLAEVASGAREQNNGIEQIGMAVHDLDRMTQQNAALVEQTAAAASTMQNQAHALSEEVARFKIPSSYTL